MAISPYLYDPRLMAALGLGTTWLVFLFCSPLRGSRYLRWIAGAGIVVALSLLLQALATVHPGLFGSVEVFLFSYLGAVAILALFVGLEDYRRPDRGWRPTDPLFVLLGPFVLLGIGHLIAMVTSGWPYAPVVSTAFLMSLPAWKAVQIYRSERWAGFLALAAIALLVPGAWLYATSAGLSLEDYRRLVSFPAALVLVMTFGVLEMRIYVERQEEMARLKSTQAELRNLTESLEETVRLRTSQLETLVTGLKGFNALVSHDLRGPLRNAAGFVDIVIEEFQNGNSEAAIAALEVIRRESRRGATMVDDLLRLSSVDEAALNIEDTDMREVFRQAIQALSMDYPNAPHAVTVGELPHMPIDGNLMRHVAINLIGNALKYGRGTPNLAVTVESEPIDAHETRFSVSDNGPGFPQEQAKKLFQPFVRLSGTRESGTGVGLTVVERVIKRHGGKVGVEAEVGKGARFWFTLPQKRPDN